MGQSERQLRDVASIVRSQGARLDREYLRRWIDEFGLGPLWESVIEA